MGKTISAILIAAALLAGCRGWWSPTSSGDTGKPYTPPGATVYACEGGKRLFVRFDTGAKSAWVIYPDREFRLDSVAAAAGERYSNGITTLAVQGGEAALDEKGKVEFARCKLERAP